MKKVNIKKLSERVTLTESFPSFDKLIILVPIIYIIVVSIYLLYHRAWFSPDQFFAVAILSVIIVGRTKQFLKDWIPVLLFLFGYEYLRGIIPFVTKYAHTIPLIVADQSMLGFNPTIKLQGLLFNPNQLQWYDYLAVILYTSHFVIPMVVAFIFWLYDRNHFRQYTSTFLLLSYLAFFTFLIFPATPPWLASNQGYLPPLNKIMDQVYASFAHPIDIPSVYRFFGANLVAAFPSLHAAYPWLIFLFVVKKSKVLGSVAFVYAMGVWFTVMYLGEHYFVDVLAAFFYASISYIIVERYVRRKKRRHSIPVVLEVSEAK